MSIAKEKKVLSYYRSRSDYYKSKLNQMDTKEETKEEKENLFSTRDLYLASTLQTMKFPVVRIDMQIEGIKPRAIGYFNFEETEELRNARREYNQGAILVEPRMYINNLQSLKAEVVNMQQNPMNNKA